MLPRQVEDQPPQGAQLFGDEHRELHLRVVARERRDGLDEIVDRHLAGAVRVDHVKELHQVVAHQALGQLLLQLVGGVLHLLQREQAALVLVQLVEDALEVRDGVLERVLLVLHPGLLVLLRLLQRAFDDYRRDEGHQRHGHDHDERKEEEQEVVVLHNHRLVDFRDGVEDYEADQRHHRRGDVAEVRAHEVCEPALLARPRDREHLHADAAEDVQDDGDEAHRVHDRAAGVDEALDEHPQAPELHQQPHRPSEPKYPQDPDHQHGVQHGVQHERVRGVPQRDQRA
mmetsp:Transcript_10916/g.29171  ORF Transcript_10916/g.29171 Transcript_10916/m.29171 type:complete len:286 (-) Transcript_10916:58-915(-)